MLLSGDPTITHLHQVLAWLRHEQQLCVDTVSFARTQWQFPSWLFADSVAWVISPANIKRPRGRTSNDLAPMYLGKEAALQKIKELVTEKLSLLCSSNKILPHSGKSFECVPGLNSF